MAWSKRDWLWAILFASAPSILLMLFVYPCWNYIDAYCFLDFQSTAVIPHYPPLYPWLCDIVQWITRFQPWCIYLLLAIQHILYIVSLMYVASYFPKRKSAMVFIACMHLVIPGLLMVHGVFSEALFLASLLLIFGASKRILSTKAPPMRLWVVYALSLALCIGSRHVGVLFSLFLPFVAFALGFYRKTLMNRHFRTILYAVAIGIVVNLFIVSITRTYIEIRGYTAYSSLIGRPGIYRIGRLNWLNMKEDQKRTLLASYYKGCGNDTICREIFRQFSEHDPEELDVWLGIHHRVQQLIDSGYSINNQKNPDYYLNKAYYVLISRPNTTLIESTLRDFNIALFTNIGNRIVHNCHLSFEPGYQPSEHSQMYKSYFSEKIGPQYTAFEKSGFFHIPILNGSIVFILAAVMMFSIRLRKKLPNNVIIISISTVAFTLLFILGSCIITVMEERYAITGMVMGHLCFGTLLTHLVAYKPLTKA